jgi:hypothetical protein
LFPDDLIHTRLFHDDLVFLETMVIDGVHLSPLLVLVLQNIWLNIRT